MKKKSLVPIIIVIITTIFIFAGNAFAAHPLITDDTGTQGKGKAQLELSGQYDHNKSEGITDTSTQLNAILAYGVIDTMDVVLGLPYLYWTSKDGSAGTKISDDGISDISLQVKWRFFEKEGWSFALRPGITLPTGDENKGLGTGRPTYSMFFITTKEAKPWEFHFNLGYIYYDNKPQVDARKDLWHASAAAAVEVANHLKLVGNVGIQTTEDKTPGAEDRAFALGGLIYSVSERLDIDAGVKFGLSKSEPDYSILGGLTFHF